jgi:hypothetical protein
MLWVDHLNYVGLDRRQRRSVRRPKERRREDCSSPAPSLRAALRQLRMRVLDAERSASRSAFCIRATATAMLAKATGRAAIAELLFELVRTVRQSGGVNSESLIHAELNRAELLLHEAA